MALRLSIANVKKYLLLLIIFVFYGILRVITRAENTDGVERIVLGLPKNMDGTVGPRAEKCETLAKELEERTGLHVVLWDERRTTVAAHEILHRSGKKEKKHRQSVDAVAATLILQGYLDFKRRQ